MVYLQNEAASRHNAGFVELEEKAAWAREDLRLPFFSFKPAGWQARSISGDTQNSSRR